MCKSPTRLLAALAGVVLAGTALFSCTNEQPKAVKEEASAFTQDHNGQLSVASQIVYDVEIINPNPDDLWTAECLEGLDQKALVDFVFEGLYSNEFSAYDIFEGTPVSARKIRKMEENAEFTRDQVGKFQFMEEWVLDTLNMTYSKHVKEIRMGLQSFNSAGELTGYAPLLRVVL
jgi:hypothetical protein